MAGKLRDVLNYKDMNHSEAAGKFRIDWGIVPVVIYYLINYFGKNLKMNFFFCFNNPKKVGDRCLDENDLWDIAKMADHMLKASNFFQL